MIFIVHPPFGQFLSTPSARRATVIAFSYAILQEFLSTPSARRATKGNGHGLLPERFLSTPSARRATRRWLGRGSGTDYFYPRPPRGGRLIMSNHQDSGDLFLSTPSARRATGKQDLLKYSYGISIHALREEGDCAT